MAETAKRAPRRCVFHHAGEGNFAEAYTQVLNMRWTGWSRWVTRATGTIVGNMDLHARAYVTLSRLRACRAEGQLVYTCFHISIPSLSLSYGMPLKGC